MDSDTLLFGLSTTNTSVFYIIIFYNLDKVKFSHIYIHTYLIHIHLYLIGM